MTDEAYLSVIRIEISGQRSKASGLYNAKAFFWARSYQVSEYQEPSSTKKVGVWTTARFNENCIIKLRVGVSDTYKIKKAQVIEIVHA